MTQTYAFETDATRRPVRQPIKVLPLAPRGFFDDSSNRARFSARPDGHNSSSQSRIFHWARNMLPGRSDSRIELRKLRSVDVPCAKGKRRDACAREKQRPIPKNATASASRPNTTQQSSGAVIFTATCCHLHVVHHTTTTSRRYSRSYSYRHQSSCNDQTRWALDSFLALCLL